MTLMSPETARCILFNCSIDPSEDFHALESDIVEQLLRYADEFRYRKPRSANGSRARYFHAYLQRRAAKGE